MKVIKKIGIRRPQGNPPAGFPHPSSAGGLPPLQLQGPRRRSLKYLIYFRFHVPHHQAPGALPQRKPNIKYQGRSGGKWGAQYFQYLNSLKYSNELESSKYQATPRPHPPNGLLQGPAPVAIPTETSIADFLNVFYGRPYNPCVGAPEATASCGLWGCLIPNGGDH